MSKLIKLSKKFSKKRTPNLMQGSVPKLIGGSQNLNSKQAEGPAWIIDVPITPQIVTLVAGAVATSIPIDKTLVNAFVSRFGVTFQEYRILGAKFVVRANTNPQSNMASVLAVYVDEKNSAAPTSSTAQDHPRIEVASNYTGKVQYLAWRVHDLLDLDWTQITTTVTPAYLKAFSDTATFGSTGGAVTSHVISGAVRFHFKGLI